MKYQRLGIDVDDLRMSVKEGLRAAAEMSFGAVELGAAHGDIAPGNLSASGRRHLSHFVRSMGLEFSALTADFPQLRLTDPRCAGERVDRTIEILSLARDLGVGVVAAGVGALTHPDSGEPSPLAVEGLSRIGECAEARGVVYAVRPAHDSAERLASVFKSIGCPALRVCLDPAAMVMSGVNPLSLLLRFPDRIALVHARDATMGSGTRMGHETRLGEGDVDFSALIEALREIDYHAAHIIRRTDSTQPAVDCAEAADAYRKWLR